MTRFVLVIIIFLTFANCAKVSVVRITESKDDITEGIRYYRPYPYLLISDISPTYAGHGRSREYKIIFLPDIAQEYAIQARAGVGAVEVKPTLEAGWNLVGLDTKLDSKTDKIIEAMGGIFEKGAKAFTSGFFSPLLRTDEGREPAPGIYRFNIDTRKDSHTYGQIIGVDLERPVISFQSDEREIIRPVPEKR